MTDSMFLNFALVMYIMSLFVLVGFHLLKKPVLGKAGNFLFTCGALCNLGSIIMRGIIAERLPFSNTYETLILFSFLMAALYTICLIKNDSSRGLLTGTVLFMIILLGLSSFFNAEPKPLVPALRSNWLAIHVLFCIISYAAFAIASIRAIVYLLKKEYKDSENSFDSIHNIIIIGYTFLTLGIVTGSIWGEAAWGSYWNWDPKEVWSLITFLMYTIYLHLRLTGKLSQKYLCIFAFSGFTVILFTYFGVNYLLTGLHAYS